MKKYKVAIYIRVSTKKQAEEGYSLDAQKERLEKMCETNGYIIYKVYADEGKSGKDTNRPAFQEMMSDMREGKFDKILVMKLDRISRSVIDLEIMIKEMQEYNVHFESASEKIDTSSSFGMMFVRLLAIFAQFERERISERINDAFEEMVAGGKPITGNQPFGYKIENGKVVIDEDKREIVEYIFDTYEKNHSLRRTTTYTNQKFNTTMSIAAVTRIICQTYYYGSYRGNDNYCTAYISKERWEKIQTIKGTKRIVKTYNPNRYYLFGGLLIDCRCNTRLVASSKRNSTKEYHYYRCGKYGTSNLCDSTSCINESYLEDYLLENLDNLIKKYFNSLEKEYDNNKINYKDNTKKLAALKEELKRTNLLFTKGRLEEEEYDKEYARLEKEIKKLEEEPTKKDITVLKDLSSMDWQTMYKELTDENKQAFWRSIIDRIELDPQNYKKGEEYIRVYFL